MIQHCHIKSNLENPLEVPIMGCDLWFRWKNIKKAYSDAWNSSRTTGRSTPWRARRCPPLRSSRRCCTRSSLFENKHVWLLWRAVMRGCDLPVIRILPVSMGDGLVMHRIYIPPHTYFLNRWKGSNPEDLNFNTLSYSCFWDFGRHLEFGGG